jgi:hypothetical protein
VLDHPLDLKPLVLSDFIGYPLRDVHAGFRR